MAYCLHGSDCLAGCGSGGASSGGSASQAISDHAAEAAVKAAFERATEFQKGSHSPAGHGDSLILRCDGPRCRVEIHQGQGSPFVYVIASYEVQQGPGSVAAPMLTAYRCPVGNSYCVAIEENVGPSPE